ncbi:hypothetical protein M2135_001510 [Parabacteroides sp. PF5-9]|nr:hypothetical protein [Parabacteroides sp. PF5-9]
MKKYLFDKNKKTIFVMLSHITKVDMSTDSTTVDF